MEERRYFIDGPPGTDIAICWEVDEDGMPIGEVWFEVWSKDHSVRLAGPLDGLGKATEIARTESDRLNPHP